MAIREILSSLRERLCQWTSPDGMEDLTDNVRGLPPPQSYEAALWAAHQKMMETATTLQSDLDRLNSEPRGRSRTHSQSGNCCTGCGLAASKEGIPGVNVGPVPHSGWKIG